MAEKYGKSFAQICLKHQLQLGLVVLPKASSE
jgi:diketogulonate reductase-like aldo/keto reductase